MVRQPRSWLPVCPVRWAWMAGWVVGGWLAWRLRLFGSGDSQPINRLKICCRSLASETSSPVYGLTGSGLVWAHPFYLLRFVGGLSEWGVFAMHEVLFQIWVTRFFRFFSYFKFSVKKIRFFSFFSFAFGREYIQKGVNPSSKWNLLNRTHLVHSLTRPDRRFRSGCSPE